MHDHNFITRPHSCKYFFLEASIMNFCIYSSRAFLLLTTLLTLSGCGTDTYKDEVVPRTQATKDALNCASFYQKEEQVRNFISSCQSDDDCISQHVGNNYFSACTNGELAVNKSADLSYFIELEKTLGASCLRVQSYDCMSPTPTVPKCSASGYCYFAY
jgi:hypothetical protein